MPGNPRWDNNEVQFARLLTEIVAALDESALNHLIRDVATSMDLTPDQVNELFDRADEVWEQAKYEVEQDSEFNKAMRQRIMQDALTRACPVCGAQPGQPCDEPSAPKEAGPGFHAER